MTDPLLTVLRANVQKRLAEMDLTPITAAVNAGQPRDTIRNLFRDPGSLPRIDTLVLIARLLDTTVDALVQDTAEPTAASIYAKIAAWCEANGVSERALSLGAGLRPDGVRNIKNGSEPGAVTAWRLARRMGVSLDELVSP